MDDQPDATRNKVVVQLQKLFVALQRHTHADALSMMALTGSFERNAEQAAVQYDINNKLAQGMKTSCEF